MQVLSFVFEVSQDAGRLSRVARVVVQSMDHPDTASQYVALAATMHGPWLDQVRCTVLLSCEVYVCGSGTQSGLRVQAKWLAYTSVQSLRHTTTPKDTQALLRLVLVLTDCSGWRVVYSSSNAVVRATFSKLSTVILDCLCVRNHVYTCMRDMLLGKDWQAEKAILVGAMGVCVRPLQCLPPDMDRDVVCVGCVLLVPALVATLRYVRPCLPLHMYGLYL